MSTRACSHCEREIPIGMAVCPYCGWKQQSLAEMAGEWRRVLLAVVLLILVVALWRVAAVWRVVR